MSARLDAERQAGHLPEAAAAALALSGPLPLAAPFDADSDLGNALPADHPAWSRDAVSISQRARSLLQSLRPIALRVLAVWDHAVRSIAIGGRRVEVDASGCYRVT